MHDLGDLSEANVHAALDTQRYGRSLSLLSSTASTNDDARKAAAAGAADGHVIVADSQTHGRGSRGKQWDSPAGEDLYLSVVARVLVPLASLPPLTLAVGLAVADAVDELLGSAVARVKWPNDVWIDRKKVAGILVEASSTGQVTDPVVIGIGLNVNRRAFPEGLETAPTSLALHGGQRFDRSRVLALLLRALERRVDSFVSHGVDPIVHALDQRLALRGELVQGEGIVGRVEGVAASGALCLATDQGRREVFSGSLRPVDPVQ